MKLKIFLLFLILAFNLFSQSKRIRGKVLDDNKNPVANLSLRFTSIGDFVTTGSGEFIITVPEGTNSVDIAIRDQGYQLLYPVDSKIPVPEDPGFINTILVAKNVSEDSDLDKSIKKFNDLEELLKEIGSTNKELQEFLKRYIELESRRLAIDELKLEEEFAKSETRNKTFSVVSPFLSEIILRLKNLHDTFEMNYELAFHASASIEYLNKSIRQYNPVFDTIYSSNKSWQESIKNGWDENLSEKFASIINYLIDEIHKPYVLRLNESNDSINKVKLKLIQGDEAEQLKSEVKKNISSILNELEIRIPILEQRVNEILNRMQFAG